MKYIEFIKTLLSFLLPGEVDQTWSDLWRETVRVLVRLLAFVVLYAILCHAVKTGVADWVETLLITVAVYGR